VNNVILTLQADRAAKKRENLSTICSGTDLTFHGSHQRQVSSNRGMLSFVPLRRDHSPSYE